MAGMMKCCLAIYCFYLTGNQVLIADGEVTQTSGQFSAQSNVRLAGSVMRELEEVGSVVRCSALCCRTESCRSFNYDRKGRHCQLNRDTKRTAPGEVLQDPRYNYYEMESQGFHAEPTSEELTATTAEPTTGEPQPSIPNTSSADENVSENDLSLPSCNAIRENGILTDGYYMIDPDGDGGAEAFKVYCSKMQSTHIPGWTKVSHNQSALTTVDKDPYHVNITYNTQISQIDALIAASRWCSQTIDAHCTNAKLWEGNVQVGWWVSRQGQQMPNWGSYSEEGCSCYRYKVCRGGVTSRCSCGVNPDETTKETAMLSSKDYLPVMALHFEGAAAPGKILQFELGELTCGGYSV